MLRVEPNPGLAAQPWHTAMPLPTLRRLIARYTMPSVCSTAARPPAALSQRPSTNISFCTGSSSREGASTGRRCSCSAVSAMRADRFDERTAANVATASASVPAPVSSEEIVVQSVARNILRPVWQRSTAESRSAATSRYRASANSWPCGSTTSAASSGVTSG